MDYHEVAHIMAIIVRPPDHEERLYKIILLYCFMVE